MCRYERKIIPANERWESHEAARCRKKSAEHHQYDKLAIRISGENSPQKRHEVRENARVKTTQLWQDPSYRESHLIGLKRVEAIRLQHTAEAQRRPEVRQKKSIASKKCWTDPEYAKKVVERGIRGRMKRPTSYEKKLIVLGEEFNIPIEYVGNGKLRVGRKNPDFVDTTYGNSLIEVYYSFFKSDNYEVERKEYFCKYGYKTLFLNENDLKNEYWKKICVAKIKSFLSY